MELLFLLAVLCYMLSSAWYFAFLFFQKKRLRQTGCCLLAAGFGLQTLEIAVAFARCGHIPAGNLHETLAICAWALVGAFLVFQYRYRVNILGIYAAPMAALILVASAHLPRATASRPDLFKSFWLVVHIITIFLGDAALALACGVGILYLLQENAIKRKNPGFFFRRLPSLDRLDTTGHACIVTGFTLLTIGIITGMIYARAVWGHFWTWDPKEVWSAVTWVFYAALLHERLAVGWRGRRAAIMAIVGFAVLLFTFLGVNFLLQGHHGQFMKPKQ